MSAELVTGDTGSVLTVTCTDRATRGALNLTGATVRLRWAGVTALVEKTMTISNALGGIATYRFLAGEIIYPKMRLEVEVTDSAGFITTSLELIEIEVRKQIG